jgi:hypothetical protein
MESKALNCEMNVMEKNAVNPMRRKFLVAAGCAPAIAVAALIEARPEVKAATRTAAPADAPVPSGYHETDHIRKYYYAAGYF